LSFSAHEGCDHIRRRAEVKIGDIEDKIRSLQKMKRTLGGILARCKAKNSPEDCPLVHGTKGKSAR